VKINLYGKERQVDDGPLNKDFWGWVSDKKWEAYTFQIFDRFLKPEMTYLDLGAWIGPTVLYAADMAKRSVAVEPDPVAFEFLTRSIQANGLKVETFQEAITGFEGSITLGSGLLGQSTTRMNRNAGGGIGAWEEGQTFITPCTTLRAFVEKHNLEDPLFIKMDVEGAEESILRDFEFFAERKPTLYISLHPFWWTQQEQAWETIRRVGRLYKHVLKATTFEDQDISQPLHGDLLFTETM
jgi:FkbM family methyltransferase